jgi:putative zinc finger/helix-turn-helix YgiT family protein
MTVRAETVDFKSLPGVKLQGVPVYRCEQCGAEEVEIPKLGDLLRLLANMVAKKPGRLTGDELRFLRKHLGWSQHDAARQLLNSDANETISRWENGKQSASFAAEQLLRVLVERKEQDANYRLQEISTGADGQPEHLLTRWKGDRWAASEPEGRDGGLVIAQ